MKPKGCSTRRARARRAGELLLYPRAVAAGNVSRIGLARDRVDSDACVFERLGYALEPHGAVRDCGRPAAAAWAARIRASRSCRCSSAS